MNRVILGVALFLISEVSLAQISKTSFKQLDSIQKIDPRPVLIFIHSDWCKFCKMMEHKTFQNDSVANVINKRFYFISLNAEDEKDITFQEHTFRFKPNGNNTGKHELALELGTINGKITFPTLCFLNSKYEIIYQVADYLNYEDTLKLLQLVTNHK